MWWNVTLKAGSTTFFELAVEASQEIAAFAKVLDQLARLCQQLLAVRQDSGDAIFCRVRARRLTLDEREMARDRGGVPLGSAEGRAQIQQGDFESSGR